MPSKAFIKFKQFCHMVHLPWGRWASMKGIRSSGVRLPSRCSKRHCRQYSRQSLIQELLNCTKLSRHSCKEIHLDGRETHSSQQPLTCRSADDILPSGTEDSGASVPCMCWQTKKPYRIKSRGRYMYTQPIHIISISNSTTFQIVLVFKVLDKIQKKQS